jgi:hypothetical protein
LRWGWVALGICDLFQHRDCALHCSLCMVSYAGLRVSSRLARLALLLLRLLLHCYVVCCARTQGIVSGARCGDARGGRGNGERAYVTVCTPAPGACARHRHRECCAQEQQWDAHPTWMRTDSPARTAPFETHRYDARFALGIPTSHTPRYNPAQDVPHTPLPAPLPALLYRYGPFRRGSSVRRGTQGCVSRDDAPVNS